MSLIPLFMAQRRAFEHAYESDDWTSLAPFLAEEIVYEVHNAPFNCRVSGRDAVIAGFRRSLDGFDRKFTRTVGIGTQIREEGCNVLVHSGIRFERPGIPAIETRLWEIATYRDDRITRILDIYDPGADAIFAQWMAEWGEGLDPSYA